MNILQVCAFGAPKPGNFIAALVKLQKELENEGHSIIYVFVERAKNQDWCKELEKTNKIYYLPERAARINPAIYKQFRRIYSENKIDVVHSHFELFDLPATLMAPKDTTVYWHLHDALKEIYYRSSKSRKILNRLQYGIFSRRATLLSVSEEHAQFVGTLGFDKKRIYYLPNGIDCSRIGLQHSETKTGFLMFGWEVQRKGVDVAIEAMQRLQNEDSRVSLKIVGQEKCKDFIEACKCRNVFYAEPVADINELYYSASGFLHISRAEGQSYALLEVIYSGIPVICSDIPENRFAKDFKNVVFVPVGDSIAVATVMKQNDTTDILIDDINYNRTIVEEKYSLNAWCTNIKAFYFNDYRGMEKCKIQS